MNNWAKYKIGDLCEVGRGSSPRPITNERFFINGNIPWIKIADATASGKYIYETKEHVNEFGASFSRYLEPNSLIIAASGVSLGQIKFLGVKGCIHDGWLYVSNYQKELLDKEYLFYFLIHYSDTFHNYSSGAAIQNINTEILRNTKISLPPLATQQKIASILSAYDELIENNKQRIKLLESMAEEIYKEWFVRLRFPNYENTQFVDGLPIGWAKAKIKDFGKVITGKTPSTLKEEYFGGEIPFIKTPDMHGNIFILATDETLTEVGMNSQKSQVIPENTICVNCIGALSGSVSITTKISQTNQQIHSVIINSLNYREFLFFLIRSLKPYILQLGNTGATMTNVSKGKFENIEVVRPSEKVIERFSEIAFPMFDEIKILSQKNQLLQQTRDLLLPRLISGKLRVEGLDNPEGM